MRILLLSQWYSPEPDLIGRPLACELVKRRHQVFSITGFPSYPLWKIYPGYWQRPWQQEQIDSGPALRLSLYPDRGRPGVKAWLSSWMCEAGAFAVDMSYGRTTPQCVCESLRLIWRVKLSVRGWGNRDQLNRSRWNDEWVRL